MTPEENGANAAAVPALVAACESAAQQLRARQDEARSIQDKIDAQEQTERVLRHKIMGEGDEGIGEYNAQDLQELTAVRSQLRDLRQLLKDAQQDCEGIEGKLQTLHDDLGIAAGRLNTVSSEALRRRGIRDPSLPEVRRHYVG